MSACAEVINAITTQKPEKSQIDGCRLFYEDNFTKTYNDDSVLTKTKRKSYKIDLSVFQNSYDDFLIKKYQSIEEKTGNNEEKTVKNDQKGSFNASYFFQNISEEDFFEKSVQIMTQIDD